MWALGRGRARRRPMKAAGAPRAVGAEDKGGPPLLRPGRRPSARRANGTRRPFYPFHSPNARAHVVRRHSGFPLRRGPGRGGRGLRWGGGRSRRPFHSTPPRPAPDGAPRLPPTRRPAAEALPRRWGRKGARDARKRRDVCAGRTKRFAAFEAPRRDATAGPVCLSAARAPPLSRSLEGDARSQRCAWGLQGLSVTRGAFPFLQGSQSLLASRLTSLWGKGNRQPTGQRGRGSRDSFVLRWKTEIRSVTYTHLNNESPKKKKKPKTEFIKLATQNHIHRRK